MLVMCIVVVVLCVLGIGRALVNAYSRSTYL